jgi:hypothetical protein
MALRLVACRLRLPRHSVRHSDRPGHAAHRAGTSSHGHQRPSGRQQRTRKASGAHRGDSGPAAQIAALITAAQQQQPAPPGRALSAAEPPDADTSDAVVDASVGGDLQATIGPDGSLAPAMDSDRPLARATRALKRAVCSRLAAPAAVAGALSGLLAGAFSMGALTERILAPPFVRLCVHRA